MPINWKWPLGHDYNKFRLLFPRSGVKMPEEEENPKLCHAACPNKDCKGVCQNPEHKANFTCECNSCGGKWFR